MQSQLWFVTDGVRALSVFESKKEAERDLDRYQDDPDYEYYECYSLDIDDLEDYPDEYELALEEGFLR